MVTWHTKNWQPLADLTLPGKVKYAKHHGYTLYWKDEGFPEGYSGLLLGAGKCLWIAELMDEHPEHEWFWWNGTDCMITNHNHTLDSILEASPAEYEFIICKDHHGINADVFFIKNTEWGKSYMRHLAKDAPTHYTGSEQGVMWTDEEIAEYRDRTLYLPMTVMNQYTVEHHPECTAHAYNTRGMPLTDVFGERYGWEQGDFVLQIVGRDMQYKLACLQSKAHLVIE